MRPTAVNPGQIWIRHANGQPLQILTVISRPDSPTLIVGLWVNNPNAGANIEVLNLEELAVDFAPPEQLPGPRIQYWMFHHMFPGSLDKASGPFDSVEAARPHPRPGPLLGPALPTHELVTDSCTSGSGRSSPRPSSRGR